MIRASWLLLLTACGSSAPCGDSAAPADTGPVTDAPPDVVVPYAGCRAEATTWHREAVQGREVRTYDDQGRLVSVDEFDAGDDQTSRTTTSWDGDHPRAVEVDAAPLGDLDQRTTYTWDGACNTTVAVETTSTGDVETTRNRCDDQGHVVASDVVDASGRTRLHVDFDVDAAGDRVAERDDIDADGTVDAALAWSYDLRHHERTIGTDQDVDGVAERVTTTLWRAGLRVARYSSADSTRYDHDDVGHEISEVLTSNEGVQETDTVWTCP